jgi:hypothetical protein
MDQPLNGLATSTEILNEQYNVLTGTETLRSTDLDADEFRAQPASVSRELFELKQTVGSIDPPGPSTALQQPATVDPEPKYFDGPKQTGRTLGSIAQEYGLPTSVRQTVDDAEDAVLGVTRDLTQSKDTKESFYDIITKDNRLRGIGALLIIAAVVAFILKILAGT